MLLMRWRLLAIGSTTNRVGIERVKLEVEAPNGGPSSASGRSTLTKRFRRVRTAKRVVELPRSVDVVTNVVERRDRARRRTSRQLVVHGHSQRYEFRPSIQCPDVAGHLHTGSPGCRHPTPQNEKELSGSSTDSDRPAACLTAHCSLPPA